MFDWQVRYLDIYVYGLYPTTVVAQSEEAAY